MRNHLFTRSLLNGSIRKYSAIANNCNRLLAWYSRMRRNPRSSLLASAVAFVASTTSAGEEAVLEEIVIEGIRGSMMAAAETKRNHDRIVDAIVAEDIGKLPDNNIAEALQRVTGISINRDFGVGTEVSIRGLPQNRVELNGRSTLGDGRNGINFEDFPASFLAAVEVAKSPTPEMTEGALGGTISMKTIRPLDAKERILSITAQGEYADTTENWAPIFSGTFGNKWDLGDAGEFGVIGLVSYQDRELRQDESRIGLDVDPLDLDGDGSDDGRFAVPKDFSYLPRIETRERTAFNLSLQWAPSHEGMFYFETNTTERSGDEQEFSPIVINNGSALSSDAERDEGFRIDDTGQLASYTDLDARFINRTESSFRETDSLSSAFGGEWQFDRLKVFGEISYAESDTVIPFSDLRFFAVDPVAEAANPEASNFLRGGVFFDSNNHDVPVVSVQDPEVFTDEDNWVFRRYENREDFINNEEVAVKLDVDIIEPIASWNFLTNVKTGVRFTNRDFESSRNRLFVTGLENQLEDSAGNPIVVPMSAFPEGSIRLYDIDAFDGDTQGDYDLNRFLAYDAELLQDEGRTLQIVADLLRGTNREIAGDHSDLTPVLGVFSSVEEETAAVYLQFHFETELFGKPVSGIVGARYVETDITSDAFERDADGNLVPTSESNSYQDWLPSANITMDLSEEMLLRFAAAKVMRRPDFDQLNPAFNINTDSTAGTRGNPQLDPFRATQYDLSLEYYWGQGNLVSGAVFYKDVESFLKSVITCTDLPQFVAISNPNVRGDLCFLDGRDGQPDLSIPLSQLGIPIRLDTNGEEGSVQGFEFGYQQSFDFLPGKWAGLGVNANYTYADSEDPDGSQLEDISEHTVNAQLYYEMDGWQFRVAYTYRDEFLDATGQSRTSETGALLLGGSSDDPTLGHSFRDALEQWDLSASYDITDSITLQANVVNLTKEPTLDKAANGSAYQIRQNDRRYTVGIRANF
mgnify:CR=1 FL=1